VTFKIFLVCSFVLLARPQDILPFLQPMRPALVLTLLAMAALVFGNHRRELAAALSTAEAKRYVLFFVIMILGIPFAYHRRLAFEGVLLLYSANVIFFVLVVSQVTSLQRLKSFLWVICLSTAMYGVFGGLLQSGSFDGGRFAVLGTTFDPNDTAYVLLSLFPLCLYFVQFDAGLLKRLIAIATVCGAVATILLTGSRGGMVAFGAVLLMLLLMRTTGVGLGRKILVVLVLASGSFLVKEKIDVERYLTLSELSSDYNVTSEGGRMKLWGEALDLSLAHPLTGVGVHCFSTAADQARRLAGESYLRWHAVHNSFLQVAAEVGLIGFAIYLLIHLRSLGTFIRLRRAPPQAAESVEIGALSGVMLLGFAGLMMSGFFLSQGYSILSTLYFALAASLERLQSQPSPAVDASHPPLEGTEQYRGRSGEPGSWPSGYRQ
jgi:O-antigen ligase